MVPTIISSTIPVTFLQPNMKRKENERKENNENGPNMSRNKTIM